MVTDEVILDKPPASGTEVPFGRVASIDPRDRRFTMPAPKTARTQRIWLSPGDVWDQGNTSQCVAYSTDRWLTSHRVVNKLHWSHAQFYAECQRNDEWDGEDYDGTSVRAAFQVLKAKGYVQSYEWAFEAEPVIRHVLEVGPVVMGTDWTWDMLVPDAKGYITPTGSLVGGHAWLILGVSRNRVNPDGSKGAIRMLNSWGAGWGQKGRAWITFADLEKLIAGLEEWPGEACTAAELKVP